MVEPVDQDVEGAHPRDLAALQDPEFVAIALLCFRGSERAGLVAHMERAIRFGATREELFEVLETCIIPGGAPTFHRGLGALMEVKGG